MFNYIGRLQSTHLGLLSSSKLQHIELFQNISTKQFSSLLNKQINLENNYLYKCATKTKQCTPSLQSLSGACRSRVTFAKFLEISKNPPGTTNYHHLYGNFLNKRTISQTYKKMAPILAPKVKLNNGYEMPVLGLGTYELKKTKCENVLREALNMGYRHIDTAYLYRNESIIGRILKQEIDQKSVKREDIFLVTKLWNIYHEPHQVKYACRKQMDALNVDYIDLYLMHSPIGYKYVDDEALMPHEDEKLQTNDIDYVETYKAMEDLVKLGWVRSLGVSNFNITQMQRILDNCCIKPVTNQVECHPALNQLKLREFCTKHNILITAYSPLARPKPTKPLPKFYESVELQQIAEKYKKSIAQVVLRYLIDIGTVPIPKSARPERLMENINIFDFQLNKEEIELINGFNANLRLWRNEMASFHPYWPFKED
ncbi:1,5-anhydro-D-fructose reductase isoform X2 [Musca autumnalis]|uniref:1,5-anhydro-D-fructose reductase isoform X2 n=1 Tax=Musca autumnalis TaxID=221902 RepID=UPI003CEBB59D